MSDSRFDPLWTGKVTVPVKRVGEAWRRLYSLNHALLLRSQEYAKHHISSTGKVYVRVTYQDSPGCGYSPDQEFSAPERMDNEHSDCPKLLRRQDPGMTNFGLHKFNVMS